MQSMTHIRSYCNRSLDLASVKCSCLNCRPTGPNGNSQTGRGRGRGRGQAQNRPGARHGSGAAGARQGDRAAASRADAPQDLVQAEGTQKLHAVYGTGNFPIDQSAKSLNCHIVLLDME